VKYRARTNIPMGKINRDIAVETTEFFFSPYVLSRERGIPFNSLQRNVAKAKNFSLFEIGEPFDKRLHSSRGTLQAPSKYLSRREFSPTAAAFTHRDFGKNIIYIIML